MINGDAQIRRLERYGLVKIRYATSEGIECRLTNKCMNDIFNRVQAGEIKKKDEIDALVVDVIKKIVSSTGYCQERCRKCQFNGCNMVLHLWKTMEKDGAFKVGYFPHFKLVKSPTLSEIEQKVMEIFEKDGEITPVIITPQHLYGCSYESEEDKEPLAKVLRERIQRERPSQYWHICEGWISKNPFTQPSKAKDRQKILSITEYQRNSPLCKYVFFDVDYTQGKPFLKNRREGTNKAAGRWNFFMEDVSDELLTAHLKRTLSSWLNKHINSIVEDATKKFKCTKEEAKRGKEEAIKKLVDHFLKENQFPIGFLEKYGMMDENKQDNKPKR